MALAALTRSSSDLSRFRTAIGLGAVASFPDQLCLPVRAPRRRAASRASPRFCRPRPPPAAHASSCNYRRECLRRGSRWRRPARGPRPRKQRRFSRCGCGAQPPRRPLNRPRSGEHGGEAGGGRSWKHLRDVCRRIYFAARPDEASEVGGDPHGMIIAVPTST